MNKKALSNVMSIVLAILMLFIIISVVFLSIRVMIKKNIDIVPRTSCIDIVSNPPIKIQKACYNSQTKDLEITIERPNPKIKINSMNLLLIFDDKSIPWDCGENCVNCNILEKGTANYYINLEEKPEKVELYLEDCVSTDDSKITNC